MGLKDWLIGKDPQQYVGDPNAANVGSAYGTVPYAQGQLTGAQGRTAAQAGYVGDQYGATDRAGQLGLAQMLNQSAMGAGPSAAGMAADQARQGTLTQAAGLQAGQRGRSSALGALMAQQGVAEANQGIGVQEAIGRQQEMTAARGQLGDVLNGVRGQDLAARGQDIQQGQYNAGLQAGQMAQNDQYGLGQEGYLGGLSQSDMQARMIEEQLRAQHLAPGSQGSLGDLISAGGAVGAAAVSDVNAKQDITPIGGGGGQSLPQMEGSSNYTPRWETTRGETLTRSILGALAAAGGAYMTRRAEKQRDAALDANIGAAQRDVNDPAVAQRQADIDAGIEKLRMMDARYANDPTGGAAAAAQAAANAIPSAQAMQAWPGPYQQQIPAYANGGIVTRPTVALVGEAGPEAIVPLSRARDMMSKLQPYEYSYRPDAGMPPGRHTGVMWQDLQKSEEGRKLDGGIDPQSGYHQVNYAKGLPAMMASLADLNSRIDRIEKKGRR